MSERRSAASFPTSGRESSGGRYRVVVAKRWSELSLVARTAIVVGSVAELAVTAFALQDLLRRPAAQVRGPKPLWGAGLLVQPVGSPLYLLVGRRRAAA